MCVIAAKPKNIVIPRETLQRCFEGNPDGAGFVVARNNQIVSSKGYFTFDSFYEAFQPYEKDVAVIHFRIKTHGKRDATNCHPFEVLPNRLWFAHNGMIDISTKNDTDKSDTWHFNDLVLKPELTRDPGALNRGSFQFMLGGVIGHSKLAFLSNRGQITIINKEKGEMDGEVWYSNGTYKNTRIRSGSGYGGYTSSAWSQEDRDTGVYYGGTTAKKSESGAGAGACAPCSQPSASSGGTQRSNTNANSSTSTAYAELSEVPASEQWIVENLRDFGFQDDDILNEINADTAEDMVLDLLIYEAGRPKDAPAMTRAEIAEELMSSAAAEDAEMEDELAALEAAEATENGATEIVANMMA